MANKSKRVKTDVSSVPELGKDDVIVRLRSELDAERKLNKQLRREKAVEVQQTRELERNEASISLKDLTAKLNHEKQREMEAQREALKCKYEADTCKISKQKDQEIKKLKNDLAKCQDDLREEVTKRGLSTSARGAFELERTKLLLEIKDLGTSKKRLEDALHSASETVKQKKQEMRQLQETCKQETAAVEKAANAEIRKLLEEMKSKDHMLALMDPNQYPDKSNNIKQMLAVQSIQDLMTASKEIDSWEHKIPKKGEGTDSNCAASLFPNINLQKKSYELEKQLRQVNGMNHAILERNQELTGCNKKLEEAIERLQKQNKQLNSDLDMVKVEASRLNEMLSTSNVELIASQLESLKRKSKEQDKFINELQLKCEKNEKRSKLKIKCRKVETPKRQKKSVRFMLPGETEPVKGGVDEDYVFDDEENEDLVSLDGSTSTDSETSAEFPSILSPIDLEEQDHTPDLILSENEMKDYNLLMKEHMDLEHSYAFMLQSQPEQDWHLERESLNLVIMTLEKKVRECEDSEEQLKMKLQEVQDQSEELEFQMLEMEGCNGARTSAQNEIADLALMEKNQKLEMELESLRKQLVVGEDSVRDVAVQCLIAPLMIDELEDTYDLDSLCNDGSEAVMMASISTATSGFDETSFEFESAYGVMNDGKFEDSKAEMENEEARKREEENLKSNEEHWVRLVENLEMRLRCSRERERQTSDKMALMNEEKNRRIRALQDQIDSLEGNECRTRIEENDDVAVGNKKSLKESDDDEDRTPTLKLELNLDWNDRSDDVMAGTPSSLDIHGCYFSHKKLDEIEEDGLYLQISNLEKDCDLLREIVDMDEGIISELQVKVEDLQQSEQNLQRIVERLEAAESQWQSNSVEMEDHMHDLEAEVKRLQTAEGWSHAQIEKLQGTERDLCSKLEETLEDMQAMEQKLKKKIADLEQEKKAWISKNEKLEDRVGELEAIDGLLRQKIRNMSYSEDGLKRKLSETEFELVTNVKRVSDLEQQKESLCHQVQVLENEKVSFSSELEDIRHLKGARCCEIEQLNKRIFGMKEALLRSEGTVSKLKSQLEESARRESQLQAEAQDCRDNEDVLFDNIAMLEGNVKMLTEKLKQSVETCSCKLKLETADSQTQTDATEFLTGCRPSLDICNRTVDMSHMTSDLDFISEDVASCADDCQSIDEASEIFDEDDGALLLATDNLPTDHTPTILQQCKTLDASVIGSLESLHDSGMDSIKICGMDSKVRHEKETMDSSTQTIYVPSKPVIKYLTSRPSSKSCINHAISSKNMQQTKQQCKLSYSSLIPLSTRYIESMKNNVLHSCRPPKPSCSTGPLTVLRAFKKTECARNSSFNGSIDSLENSSIVKIKVFAPEDSTVLSPSEHRSTSDRVVQPLVEHLEAHHHQTPSSQSPASDTCQTTPIASQVMLAAAEDAVSSSRLATGAASAIF